MIPIKEIVKFYFEKIDNSLPDKEKKEIFNYLIELEKKEFKKIPYGLKNPVFEILVGISGSGKTFKIESNLSYYKDYLIIDPDVFRKKFKSKNEEYKRKIPSIIKDILVFYGISNGMNTILQSGKWNEKRDFFLYIAKYREKFFENLCYNSSDYFNKITILSTHPSIAYFSAYYRYFIEKQKFYISPIGDNYIEEGIKSIHNFLIRIKNKSHIRPYVTENKYCFEIKGIPLFKTIDKINFIDRYSLIKSFILPKDEKQIKELFPLFFRATMYREIDIESIYEEYKKITKAINYCQKNKNEDFLKKSLLYFSYIGYSIVNYISDNNLLSEKERKEFKKNLEKIRKDEGIFEERIKHLNEKIEEFKKLKNDKISKN